MTAEERAALVERVRELLFESASWPWKKTATAAIDLIRTETLEEAARVADSHAVSPDPVGVIKAMAIAAAIRTRKEKP